MTGITMAVRSYDSFKKALDNAVNEDRDVNPAYRDALEWGN